MICESLTDSKTARNGSWRCSRESDRVLQKVAQTET
jgi:hypothetical protein